MVVGRDLVLAARGRLPAGRDARASVAEGRVMRPDVLAHHACDAGCTPVEGLPIEHSVVHIYRPVVRR